MSAKSPEYRDTVYIDSLIGLDTIITMPHATLGGFIDYGTARRTVDRDLNESRRVVHALSAVGTDLELVAEHLEADEIAAFPGL